MAYRLSLILIIGAALRFTQISDNPYWVDEVLGFYLPGLYQEQLPFFINALTEDKSEFWTRFPYALAGTLTPLFVFLAIKNKRYAILAALIVATFPLFVFWSTLARPYVLAGLFCAIGWRWKPAYFLAMLCTPVAIFGVHYKDWKWGIACAFLAVGFFLIRPDSDRAFFDPTFLLNARRIYVVPCLMLVMYLFGDILPRIVKQPQYKQLV